MFSKKKNMNKDKEKFDHIMKISESLDEQAIRDLIKSLGKPLQFDFILGVSEEGQDARVNMTPSEFFFEKINYSYGYEELKTVEKDRKDYPLQLASDLVLPWPWDYERYVSAINNYSTLKGKPWKQDHQNHYVNLWLPWGIGFVEGGNHSIAAGIMAGEGELLPEHVYDMSFILERVRTNGIDWYLDGEKVQSVKRYRTAAIFELGRKLAERSQS